MHTESTGRDGIGAVLKLEREARGLSLDEIAARTRIQRSQLEAIEREELHLLPPGPFVTGFVTSYARALGLRPEELLPLLPEQDGRSRARVAPSLDMEVREIPVGGLRPAANSGSWLLLAGLVLVVVLLGVAWQSPKVRELLLQRSGPLVEPETSGARPGASSLLSGLEPKSARSEDAVAQSAGGKGTDKATTGSAKDSVGELTPRADRPDSDGNGARATPAEDARAAESRETGAREPASPEGEGGAETLPGTLRRLSPFVSETDRETFEVFADSSVRAGQNQTVIVQAKARTYLKVSPSPTSVPSFEGVLQAGEEKTFSTAGELWLVFGNAAGVELTVNGAALGKLGRYGERKGVAFRPQAE